MARKVREQTNGISEEEMQSHVESAMKIINAKRPKLIHFVKPTAGDKGHYFACGAMAFVGNLNWTRDKSEVTCERCKAHWTFTGSRPWKRLR